MATSVSNTNWSSFLSDKAHTAWWVWTAPDAPELWTTRARPFWARVLTKIGRTVDPNGPITVTVDDIKLLRSKLIAAGQTPKFPATQNTVDAEVARAAAWLTFHEPNGTPDDLWFPRMEDAGEVVQGPLLGTPLIGTGEATSAPEHRTLTSAGEDLVIRKSVGLEPDPTEKPPTGGAQQPPADGKGSMNWTMLLGIAAVGGFAWWALSGNEE